MARVLVTGGFGYLGGRICEVLRQGGHEIRIPTRRGGQDLPSWAAEMEPVQANLANQDDLARICDEVEVVVHLAAMNEIDAATDPIGAVRINSLNTLKLLLAAEQAGVKRFVYFSTAHVYQNPLIGQFDERSLTRPVQPHAYSHKAAEDYVLALAQERRIEGVVLRVSNGFGAPRDEKIDRWSLLTNDLCRMAVEKGELVLRGSGLAPRNFIPLSDVAKATQHFIDLAPEALGDGIFNVGSEKSVTVYEMAQLIQARAKAVLGKDFELKRPEPKPGEKAGTLVYSIEKLKQTGFVHLGNDEAEIDRTLLLCRSAFGR